MKRVLLALSLLLCTSCFPTRTAPNISTYKLQQANRFKKGLPKETGFIFEDRKEEGAFFGFLKDKFALTDDEMDYAIPIQIEERNYLLNFHEMDRTSEVFMLGLAILDAAVSDEEILDDYSASGSPKWYIVLMVLDTDLKDALDKEYPHQKEVRAYLDLLRREYYGLYSPEEELFRQPN